jgi:hypothetical protein
MQNIQNPIEKITKSELHHLYVEKNLSDKEIASIYNVGDFKIWSLRKKFGIKGINFQHRRLIKKPQLPISGRQNSIILGSLLGDCCLKTNKGSNNKSLISIAHSEKQKDYIYWLRKELSSICHNNPQPYVAHEKYIVYTITSESRSDLFTIRNRIYTPKKSPNEWWLSQIDDLSLAVWYMDDGSMAYKNKTTSLVEFATNSFTESENFGLKNMLLKNFGLHSEVVPKKINNKIQYTLAVEQGSTNKFVEIVSPHIIDSMAYKLPGELNKQFLSDNVEPGVNKQTLQHLYYDRQLTQQQIASVLGVHKQTVIKYMHVFGINPRSCKLAQLGGKNQPPTCKHSSVSLPGDNEKINQKAKNIFKQMRKDGFPFVQQKENIYYIQAIDKMMIKNIANYVNGNKISYCKNGLELCSVFCPQIFQMSSNNSLSPMEIFNDDEKLLDCIKRTIIYAKKDSVAAIRQGLKTYRNNRCVTIFPPMWAKIILQLNLQKLNCLQNEDKGISVLDFSCGFGGRLIGCYASQMVRNYTGIDPIKENINSHQKIYEIIQQHKKATLYEDNPKFKAAFLHGSAEDIIPNMYQKFDVILTSPPYFNKEKYSIDNTQCYNKFEKYDKWRDNWLKPILQQSFNLLNKQGIMIIFMSDFGKTPTGKDCMGIMQSIFQQDVECFQFRVPSLEYYRSKGIEKYDMTWVVQKHE